MRSKPFSVFPAGTSYGSIDRTLSHGHHGQEVGYYFEKTIHKIGWLLRIALPTIQFVLNFYLRAVACESDVEIVIILFALIFGEFIIVCGSQSRTSPGEYVYCTSSRRPFEKPSRTTAVTIVLAFHCICGSQDPTSHWYFLHTRGPRGVGGCAKQAINANFLNFIGLHMHLREPTL